MLTIIESVLFSKHWSDYWSDDEHGEFVAFLAANPDAANLIPGTGGCRKVRWAGEGKGRRGGLRIVYTARLASGSLVLLLIYGKSARENIPAHVLRKIAEELGHGPE
ncbi:MAG: transcriptional regulator [Gammaproteobacteria bacterium]